MDELVHMHKSSKKTTSMLFSGDLSNKTDTLSVFVFLSSVVLYMNVKYVL